MQCQTLGYLERRETIEIDGSLLHVSDTVPGHFMHTNSDIVPGLFLHNVFDIIPGHFLPKVYDIQSAIFL